MNSNNTYYQRNKKNSARSIKNCYHQGGTKEKASECYKMIKKGCKRKPIMNTGNYLMKKIYKKRIWKKLIHKYARRRKKLNKYI